MGPVGIMISPKMGFAPTARQVVHSQRKYTFSAVPTNTQNPSGIPRTEGQQSHWKSRKIGLHGMQETSIKGCLSQKSTDISVSMILSTRHALSVSRGN